MYPNLVAMVPTLLPAKTTTSFPHGTSLQSSGHPTHPRVRAHPRLLHLSSSLVPTELIARNRHLLEVLRPPRLQQSLQQYERPPGALRQRRTSWVQRRRVLVRKRLSLLTGGWISKRRSERLVKRQSASKSWATIPTLKLQKLLRLPSLKPPKHHQSSPQLLYLHHVAALVRPRSLSAQARIWSG